jgi:hypothetical protein
MLNPDESTSTTRSGPQRAQRADHLAPRSDDPVQIGQELEQAAHRDVPLVHDQLDARLLHLRAAEPDEARVRQPRAQLADEVAGVDVARGVALPIAARAHSRSSVSGIASITRSAVRSAATACAPVTPESPSALRRRTAVDEHVELCRERVLGIGLERLHLDLLGAVGRRHAAEQHRLLGEEVDREVGVALEQPELAHRRRRHAARGQVRDARAGKVSARSRCPRGR